MVASAASYQRNRINVFSGMFREISESDMIFFSSHREDFLLKEVSLTFAKNSFYGELLDIPDGAELIAGMSLRYCDDLMPLPGPYVSIG